MANVETVKVKHDKRDFVVINKSDYNPDVHVLYSEKEEKPVVVKKPAAKKKKSK